MSMKQLDTLYRFETDKEQKAAQQLQAAQLDYQQNIQRLESVGEYRLEYMKRLSGRSVDGIDSATFSHFHAFIAKLDHAAEQVKIAMKQAKALAEQQKQLWLIQKQKVRAVELLRTNAMKKMAIVASRKEQKMFDEMSTQQYVRRHLSSF